MSLIGKATNLVEVNLSLIFCLFCNIILGLLDNDGLVHEGGNARARGLSLVHISSSMHTSSMKMT